VHVDRKIIRHKRDLYEYLVIAECKFWNTPVDRSAVDVLANTMKEVGGSQGVIFSTKGFQAGAVEQAKFENIELFTVRELSDAEWGCRRPHT
jgi:Restriction endonuclease